MKKNILLFICICLHTLLFAQTDKVPQVVSYQAVAHDATGKVLANKAIGVKIEILKSSINGNCVFSETHSLTSNATGTITIPIGQGNATMGSFSDIDWGTDTYFLQLSMDIQGSTDYKKISTTQMLPVPIALYAVKAGTAENGNGGEGNNSLKFLILPSRVDELHTINDMVTGKEIIEEDRGGSNVRSLYLAFNIVYLDRNDQNLYPELEGLPADVEEAEPPVITKSSIAGRYVMWHYLFKIGSYDLKLVLKKDEQVIKEYPFKFTVKEKENKETL
ncbi:hypothetical protein [Parabacteroides sp.]